MEHWIRILKDECLHLHDFATLEAARQVNLSIPLVVRMEGTNVEQGKQILKDSGIKVISASDMADAARRIVEAIR